MKHQWLAYVIVGMISVGAGVAIAGLPNNVPVDATIVPPTTTEEPDPADTSTTTTTTVADDEEEDEDVTETTEPSVPDSTVAPVPGRGDVAVVAANGANVAGAAGRISDRLEGIGYLEVQPRDGTDVVELTVVYYSDGFEEAAEVLAADLDLADGFVRPIAEAPNVLERPDIVDLLVYIGLDRAN